MHIQWRCIINVMYTLMAMVYKSVITEVAYRQAIVGLPGNRMMGLKIMALVNHYRHFVLIGIMVSNRVTMIIVICGNIVQRGLWSTDPHVLYCRTIYCNHSCWYTTEAGKKIVVILQTILSNVFFSMKKNAFWLSFQDSLFPSVQFNSK